MSGLDEILPWAIENFPPEDYSSFQEWFDAVSADFIVNNRKPLDEILDVNEFNIMENAWDEAVSGIFQDAEPETKQELIQEIIESSTDVIEQKAKETVQERLLEQKLDQPEIKEQIQQAVKPSLLRKISSFFGRLFKR